jgi:hypothetical protein
MDFSDQVSDDANIDDVNWDTAEQDLIPVDRSHFTDEALQAMENAEAELAAEEARIDAVIQEFYAEEQTASEVATTDDDTGASEEQPSSFTESAPYATTELGLATMVETGPESPERMIYNDTATPEGEQGGNPERMG